MAKLQIKSETIATFGGIFKIMEIFERLGLGKLVDSKGKWDGSLIRFIHMRRGNKLSVRTMAPFYSVQSPFHIKVGIVV